MDNSKPTRPSSKPGRDAAPSHSLACTEVWGGNHVVNLTVEVPGFMGWVYSRPLEPATSGGDVYYLSVCSKGLLSRVVIADVAGHGQAVSASAMTLRRLLRDHMNDLDQSHLMHEMNDEFHRTDDPYEVQYATAVVLSYFCPTSELIFTNAGHPAALWYHAPEKVWSWLREDTPYSQSRMEGVPLGLIPGTDYLQNAVRLSDGDLLILYSDGISESTNAAGAELGYEGLLSMATAMPEQATKSPAAAGQALISLVRGYRGSAVCFDDQSLIVLQQTAENMEAYARP
jgi:sigma-B regulation protein RsbU (phosphoserine phosphatase)